MAKYDEAWGIRVKAYGPNPPMWRDAHRHGGRAPKQGKLDEAMAKYEEALGIA